jgi:hypothetical protein
MSSASLIRNETNAAAVGKRRGGLGTLRFSECKSGSAWASCRHGERIAIEVELTLKNRARRAEIARETTASYDRVWHFAAPKLLPLLSRIAAKNLCRTSTSVPTRPPLTTPTASTRFELVAPRARWLSPCPPGTSGEGDAQVREADARVRLAVMLGCRPMSAPAALRPKPPGKVEPSRG